MKFNIAMKPCPAITAKGAPCKKIPVVEGLCESHTSQIWRKLRLRAGAICDGCWARSAVIRAAHEPHCKAKHIWAELDA